MAGATDYFENLILDAVLGDNKGANIAATVHVALFTSTPDDTGGGTECSGTGYLRAAVTNNSTEWPNATLGSKSNGQLIQFPAAGAADWGTITHVAIYDDTLANGGNMLMWSSLSNSTTPALNDAPFFAANAITFTMD